VEASSRRQREQPRYGCLTAEFVNEEAIPLDRFRFDSIKLQVQTVAPEVVVLGELFPVKFLMRNISPLIINGKITVKNSPLFFMIGEPQQRIRLDPDAVQELQLQLLPLKLGFHPLNLIEIYESTTVNNNRMKQTVVLEVSNESVQVVASRPLRTTN